MPISANIPKIIALITLPTNVDKKTAIIHLSYSQAMPYNYRQTVFIISQLALKLNLHELYFLGYTVLQIIIFIFRIEVQNGF
ncbi:hypothetical protein HMPREF1866_01427 [Lachnoanaerobaculum saburreum]|uniref:Uncharacterized protein n=1 Tax=Lachnoanaerobaculum saburreum TaxID=467210 RepID=A0A133ZPH1_9FIRM|nr:hypothetical protein HMPREF1866_01427 [Lachnoanaerobaculum saburreum]